MPYVDIVTSLAVVQVLVFGFKVGVARGRFGVKAPATTGNEMFERYLRVQMNTLELLVALLPGMYIFGHYFGQGVAASLGVVYLLGRELYSYTYLKDPAKREVGYGMSFLPVVIVVIGSLIGAVRAALALQPIS